MFFQQEAAPATQVHLKSEMETGNRAVARNSAGSRITARRARQSTPDSKALGRIRKSCPSRITGTSYLTSTKSWTKYAKSTVLPGSLQTIPTEIVGSSSNLANSTPNTRGSTYQARTTTNPTSRAPENKRSSHKKSKQ